MTLPHERLGAISRTRQFLVSLVDGTACPQVPDDLRHEASGLLKHYPADAEVAYRRELRLFWEPDEQPGMEGSGRIISEKGHSAAPQDPAQGAQP